MKKRDTFACGTVLLLLQCATATAMMGNRTEFTLRESSPGGWTIEYSPMPVPFTTVDIDGKPHLLFQNSPGTNPEAAGTPLLPVHVLSVGIPFGVSVSVELAEPLYETIEGQLVAPQPEYTFSNENEAVANYRKDPRSYSENRLFPDLQVRVEAPTTLRHQRISTVRIAPYQYNPATRSLRRMTRAILKVRMSSVDGGPVQQVAPALPLPDPHFEHVYKSILWNYDQAKQWRWSRSFLPDSQSGPDPTRDWFETGRAYYRILIGQDGWHKITRADLVAAGVDPSQIDVPSLRLFGRGSEVPIHVRPDTTIEFHALRNYGDSTYLDFYTDTSTYWLTWNGPAGARYTVAPQPAVPAVLDVRSAQVTKHFETNTDYYDGTGLNEISNIEQVPGEGWVWTYFYPNGTIAFPFDVDSVDAVGGPSCSVRVRLFSTTLDYQGYDHDARFWVNDSLAGEVFFDGRTGVTFSATFPATWLREGTNSLRIMSVPTQSVPNQFYLDWFEVDYQRRLNAVGGQLLVTSPPTSGGSPALFTVTGFPDSSIEAFDLTGKRLVTGGTVSGDSVSGYALAFKDTFSTSRSYLVVSAAGRRPIPPLAVKLFADIRVNTQGADYIIIAHRNFLSSAQQLAAQRQAVHGLRTKVIDVQEIYDEFNYGVLNATRIKTFLKYAFEHWASPAPTYLLMFGDASWDYHRYMSTTIKTNYVPAYGVPAGDNWFTCFSPDTTFLPSMLVGRLTVQDSVQAQRVVEKIIGYDSYSLHEWNKNFLFITGGTTPAEQASFNSLIESLINTHISVPPLGGTPFRVRKSTPAVIDGEHKQYMKDLVRDGLVFMYFLGHSGGRIWNVDIGPPSELENTDGKLPFVSSVSCNVGAFAEPSSNVLAEDFTLGENRGAIGAWAASSLGYAVYGTVLTDYFLSGIAADSIRDFGALTTVARFKLWQLYGSTPTIISSVHLNPLFGDPVSQIAIPLKPDLAVFPEDVTLSPAAPTPNDSILTIRVDLHNFGLVPSDSPGVSINDIYGGGTTTLLNNRKLSPTHHRDSLFVSWDAALQVGKHTLVTSLDPGEVISEVNELNNIVAEDQYVFANLLSVVKPLDNMVVSPGVQPLVVTSPVGLDSIGFHYIFELDTVPTFDSPFLVSSGPVMPGPVSGSWSTPSLPAGLVCFWRARTVDSALVGQWVVSSFTTSSDLPPEMRTGPKVRWRESKAPQFARELLHQAEATDSGVTIAPAPPTSLYCRSLCYRANPDRDYYSIIRINEQTIVGHWWMIGGSFMVLRVDPTTGGYIFSPFNVSAVPTLADSMARFIQNTPVGNYLAFSVIFDGWTNVNESLYVALESLGSTMIRQVLPGHSWAMIGRKGSAGPGMQAVESWSPDSVAEAGLQIENYYASGFGSITGMGIRIPASFDSLHWRSSADPGISDIRLALIGVRNDGVSDTLRLFPRDSMDMSLGFLNALTSGPRYVLLRPAALLSTTDAFFTPVLSDWWMDFEPPADLAVSARTVGVRDVVVQRGTVLDLPVTVHNIGFRATDSARVTVSVYDRYNKARPVAYAMLDSVVVNGTRSTVLPISTTDFSRRVTLQIRVDPSKKNKDLVAENNTAYYSFEVTGNAAGQVQIFADGVQVMDGDYVSSRPNVVVRLPKQEHDLYSFRHVEFFVDQKPAENAGGMQDAAAERSERDAPAFTLEIPDGRHELGVRVIQTDLSNPPDTLNHTVVVNVLNESRIVQLYNHPNPFSRDTHFMFMLTGAEPADEVVIRIFTVAGRKIREIVVPSSALHIGFNRVHWDGRDSDGDEIANGYYLYQVSVKARGKSVSVIQKLVKVR